MKWWRNLYTVELHSYGLIGTVSHPDMQKLQIIGTFFEVGKKFLQKAV
jgi:hypothetical protein